MRDGPGRLSPPRKFPRSRAAPQRSRRSSPAPAQPTQPAEPLATPPIVSRVSRRVGRDRRQHRLAIQAGPADGRAAARADRDPGPGAVAAAERRDLPGSPAGDALYESKLEPWSEYLTGEQGRAPEPVLDPLAFAVDGGPAAGLELHAWFNPYRARHPSAQVAGLPEPRQPTAARPRSGRTARITGSTPASERRASTLPRVVLDVVKRYDIDGVHIDDYFYPYPETDAARGSSVPRRRDLCGVSEARRQLDRDDWRRRQRRPLVEQLYKRT